MMLWVSINIKVLEAVYVLCRRYLPVIMVKYHNVRIFPGYYSVPGGEVKSLRFEGWFCLRLELRNDERKGIVTMAREHPHTMILQSVYPQG